MDATTISKAKLPNRQVPEGLARSGRTLAEMGAHIFPRNRAGGIFRLDVAGKVEPTLPQVEPAERAKDWKLRRTGYRSGATGKCAHVPGAVFVHGIVGRPGAKETQCYADI